MKNPKTRTHLSTSGSFVAIPSAFPAADEGLRNVLKLEFKTVFSAENPEGLNLETVFSPNRFLVDLGAVIPTSLDPQKISRDCDLIKKALATNPKQLMRLVEVFHGDHPDIDEAFKIAQELGLTEEAAVKAGGGFLALIVLLVIVVAAAGCAHTKPYKKPDPNPAK